MMLWLLAVNAVTQGGDGSVPAWVWVVGGFLVVANALLWRRYFRRRRERRQAEAFRARWKAREEKWKKIAKGGDDEES